MTMNATAWDAGSLVTARVPVAEPEESAAAVWSRLLGTRFDSVDDVAVCLNGRIRGMVRMEDLLAAPPDTLVADIMDPEPPVVAPGIDREVVAWKAVQHGEASMAVADEQGRFVGLIPANRMLSVLLEEHAEDLARVSGYLHRAAAARSATEEPVGRRYIHRLPWLLLGLAGSAVAAVIVARFEARLQANLSLAFFLPGIVYLADAVGTQTEAVIVRGLSVGASIRTTLRREIITGLLIGLTLALIATPLGLATIDPDVVPVVAISLFAASAVATAVAMTLPSLLDRLGADPAFGSGPLATVIQDLLSILIYFMVASAWLQ
ncbi:MAG TPA: magnesium transporter [Acidimicrobiia bacterium]|nr:magnesium transporter [Acidimicrobiia bacterium]